MTDRRLPADSPRVSVVIPAYKAALTLEEAVDSCLGQSKDDLEVLVIEDGSKDGTLEVAEKCRRKDPERVRVLRHAGGVNKGVAASRNLGLDMARGEFIAFLDADDAWLPDKLRIQLEVMDREPAVGLVFGNVYLSSDPDPSKPMQSQALGVAKFRIGLCEALNEGKTSERHLINLHREGLRIVPSPTPLVRKFMFASGLRFLGQPRLRLQYEDYLMWKVLSMRTRFHYVAEPLAIYREHSSSFTGGFQRSGSTLLYLQGMQDVHREFLLEVSDCLDADFLAQLQAREGSRVLSSAARIPMSDWPAYLRLAASYGVAGAGLRKLLEVKRMQAMVMASALKRRFFANNA